MSNGCRRVDVDDEEGLLERGRPCDDLAVLVDHERVPVEDELVLPADGVHECDPAHVVPGANGQHLLALPPFADVKGRRRDIRNDMRAGQGEFGRGRSGLPDVLTDRGADQRFAHAQ